MHWTVKINGDPNVNLPTEVFRDAYTYITFHIKISYSIDLT